VDFSLNSKVVNSHRRYSVIILLNYKKEMLEKAGVDLHKATLFAVGSNRQKMIRND